MPWRPSHLLLCSLVRSFAANGICLHEPVQGLNLNRRSISGLDSKMPVTTSNPTWIGLGLKPGLRGESPATVLSHGTAAPLVSVYQTTRRHSPDDRNIIYFLFCCSFRGLYYHLMILNVRRRHLQKCYGARTERLKFMNWPLSFSWALWLIT